jgi:hypothetical protein
MFRFDAGRPRPAEYSMVVEPHPAGPTIGVFRGLPIAERVVDQFGRPFAYVGVARRRRDGQFDVASLKPGEFVVEPGITYRLESGKYASQDTVNSDGPSLAQPPQLPHEGVEVPADPGEDSLVLGEIARTLMFFLTGALIIQLVLHVFHAG